MSCCLRKWDWVRWSGLFPWFWASRLWVRCENEWALLHVYVYRLYRNESCRYPMQRDAAPLRLVSWMSCEPPSHIEILHFLDMILPQMLPVKSPCRTSARRFSSSYLMEERCRNSYRVVEQQCKSLLSAMVESWRRPCVHRVKPPTCTFACYKAPSESRH